MEYTKLEANFKKRWLLSLRSGEYKQGIGQLHDVHTDTYCCLGVACVVASVHKNLIDHGQRISIRIAEEQPLLKSLCGSIDHASASMLLMEMNDTDKKTFAEIADWVEENL